MLISRVFALHFHMNLSTAAVARMVETLKVHITRQCPIVCDQHR